MSTTDREIDRNILQTIFSNHFPQSVKMITSIIGGENELTETLLSELAVDLLLILPP